MSIFLDIGVLFSKGLRTRKRKEGEGKRETNMSSEATDNGQVIIKLAEKRGG